VSSETLTRPKPAARRRAACSASSRPLVESAMSSIPGIACSSATSCSSSRRISGSPPVSRMLRTPTDAAARTISAISS
jgi:hypothetical protein